MFTPKRALPTNGFTLVELLTVIAIIAVLMGILFPTINSAIESAKKTQAKNDELQIVNAIKGYYTEYGKYPSTGANTGSDSTDYFAGDDATGSELMDALRVPVPTSTYALNPRKIVFLEVPASKNSTKPKAGIGGNGRFYDPWGYVYRVKIDNNYNGTLDNPYNQNAGPTSLNTGVIVWSIGRDGGPGSGDKNSSAAKDDVISWQ